MATTTTDRLYGESSGVAVKAPVMAATNGQNLPLVGLSPVAGYTPLEGDRILVKDQANPIANGIYNASVSAWQRTGDFDGSYDVVKGTLVVALYNNSQGLIFQLITANPVINTTPLNFTPFWQPQNIYYPIIPAESTNSVAPVNFFYAPGKPRRYGALLDGVTNDTAAFMAAINMGQPDLSDTYGVAIVDTLYIPNRQGPVNFAEGFRFLGPGPGLLIFQAAQANERIIAKVQTAGVCDTATIGGFSCKAHASGSTTTAVDCSGFRFTDFPDISGLANGTKGFFSLVSASAYPYLCYKNKWSRTQLNGVAGFTKMIDFNNGGTGNAANNCNVGIIEEPLCYACSGMTVIIDGYRSAKIKLIGGDFEDCPGADAVYPGQAWSISDGWYELVNSPAIVPGAPESGSATVNILIYSNYFSASQTINFPSGCTGSVGLENKCAGTMTFTGDTTNHLIQTDIAAPAAPTLSAAAGSLAPVGAINPVPQNLIQETTYLLEYTYTPAATGPVALTLSAPPSGYSYLTVSASAIRGANGDPKGVGWDPVNSKVWANYSTTDSHNIIVYVTLSKPYS